MMKSNISTFILVIVIFSLVSSSKARSAGVCRQTGPSDTATWVYYVGKCYAPITVRESVNFNEAANICSQLYGSSSYLASVGDEEVSGFLVSDKFMNQRSSFQKMMIGLRFFRGNGRWADNAYYGPHGQSYQRFSSGQNPETASSANLHSDLCTVVAYDPELSKDPNKNGQWSLVECSSKLQQPIIVCSRIADTSDECAPGSHFRPDGLGCVPCPPGTYQPTTSRTFCEACTPPGDGFIIDTEGSGATSQHQCHRPLPVLGSIDPTDGLQAGSTMVKLEGTNFLIDSNITVAFGEALATIVASDSTYIICQSPPFSKMTRIPSRTNGVTVPVEIRFSNGVTRSTSFVYRPNPTVDRFEPTTFLVSGGQSIAVRGSDFDAAQTHVLVLQVSFRGSPYTALRSHCTLESPMLLLCKTPDISSLLPRARSTEVRQRRQAYSHPNEMCHSPFNARDWSFRFSFVFEQTYQVSAESDVPVAIFEDPVIDRWPEDQPVNSVSETIRIKGHHLACGVRSTDVSVMIADRICNIQRITTNEIICQPPKQISPNRLREPVMVQIGSHIAMGVGYLKYGYTNAPTFLPTVTPIPTTTQLTKQTRQSTRPSRRARVTRITTLPSTTTTEPIPIWRRKITVPPQFRIPTVPRPTRPAAVSRRGQQNLRARRPTPSTRWYQPTGTTTPVLYTERRSRPFIRPARPFRRPGRPYRPIGRRPSPRPEPHEPRSRPVYATRRPFARPPPARPAPPERVRMVARPSPPEPVRTGARPALSERVRTGGRPAPPERVRTVARPAPPERVRMVARPAPKPVQPVRPAVQLMQTVKRPLPVRTTPKPVPPAVRPKPEPVQPFAQPVPEWARPGSVTRRPAPTPSTAMPKKISTKRNPYFVTIFWGPEGPPANTPDLEKDLIPMINKQRQQQNLNYGRVTTPSPPTDWNKFYGLPETTKQVRTLRPTRPSFTVTSKVPERPQTVHLLPPQTGYRPPKPPVRSKTQWKMPSEMLNKWKVNSKSNEIETQSPTEPPFKRPITEEIIVWPSVALGKTTTELPLQPVWKNKPNNRNNNAVQRSSDKSAVKAQDTTEVMAGVESPTLSSAILIAIVVGATLIMLMVIIITAVVVSTRARRSRSHAWRKQSRDHRNTTSTRSLHSADSVSTITFRGGPGGSGHNTAGSGLSEHGTMVIENGQVLSGGHGSPATRANLAAATATIDRLPLVLHNKINDMLIHAKRIKVTNTLVRGQYGDICLGKLWPSNAASPHDTITVTIKTLNRFVMDLDSTSLIEAFLSDALMLKGFYHRNVSAPYAIAFSGQRPLVIYPYYENGSLKAYITNKNKEILVFQLLDFASQIATAMVYLSAQNFIHKDLATRNCVVTPDFEVKVADNALVKDVYGREYVYVEQARDFLPVRWMAPESLTDLQFSLKSDVWSFGVVFWELLTRGRLPHSQIHNSEVVAYLQQQVQQHNLGGTRPVMRLPRPSSIPPELCDVVDKCCQLEPSRRPTFGWLQERLTTLLDQRHMMSAYNVPIMPVEGGNSPTTGT